MLEVLLEEVAGGITAAAGFRAAGVHCGVKKAKKDLALVVSDVPAASAGVFTLNKVAAAPVVLDKLYLAQSTGSRGIVVNSGNANACTGERGMADAKRMAASLARFIGCKEQDVFVSSTGVIGQHLPIENIEAGIKTAYPLLKDSGGREAADAILTTDTFSKEVAVRFQLGDVTVTVGGMSKGSGMIAPNMATMLAFVTTDATITPWLLQEALAQATKRSFNRITVDGDTSTNDMVIVMANGKAANAELTGIHDPMFARFYQALEYVLIRLSKMIVMDGEGATKFVEIVVAGARSEEEAERAARSVANSNLVKTAIHGEDANWGRILAAVGYSGIDFNPGETTIHFGEVPILKRGYSIDFSEDDAARVLSKKEIVITVDLHQGNASATFWTCDLSKDYVSINANYRT